MRLALNEDLEEEEEEEEEEEGMMEDEELQEVFVLPSTHKHRHLMVKNN